MEREVFILIVKVAVTPYALIVFSTAFGGFESKIFPPPVRDFVPPLLIFPSITWWKMLRLTSKSQGSWFSWFLDYSRYNISYSDILSTLFLPSNIGGRFGPRVRFPAKIKVFVFNRLETVQSLLQSRQKHHQSKGTVFLHRSCTPKKIQLQKKLFFSRSKKNKIYFFKTHNFRKFL